MTTETQILTTNQAARFLKIHMVTLGKLIRAKKIPGFRVGGQWRYRMADLELWIAKQQSA